MLEISYEIGVMSRHSLTPQLKQFCIDQAKINGAEYSGSIFDHFAGKGGIFCAAVYDGKIVGSTSSVPAKGNGLFPLIGVTDWLLENGYLIEETDYPAMTYVDPDYQGNGIANETHRRKFQYQIDRGFKQSINFAFETQSAFNYYQHLGNLHDTGLPEYYGQPIYLTPLQDALLSVS